MALVPRRTLHTPAGPVDAAAWLEERSRALSELVARDSLALARERKPRSDTTFASGPGQLDFWENTA